MSTATHQAAQMWRTVTGAGELVAYGLLTVLGFAAAVYGRRYGLTNAEGEIGAGMLPVVAGVLLGLLGLGLLVHGVRSRLEVTGSPAEQAEGNGDVNGTDIHGRTGAQRVRNLWIVFGLLFLTLNLVAFLGLVIAFGLFVLVSFVVVERRSVLPSLAITLCACAFIYVVFGRLLSVPLPEGLLGV